MTVVKANAKATLRLQGRRPITSATPAARKPSPRSPTSSSRPSRPRPRRPAWATWA
ncbi:MAG: hypothetical protein M0C28_42240 [Candidatus Moduliflexus flocculans]|nr:hypothetical protein [Candidatus Moduliflexus flocculans]